MLLAVDVGGTPVVGWAPGLAPGAARDGARRGDEARAVDGAVRPEPSSRTVDGLSGGDRPQPPARAERMRDASADAGDAALTEEQRALIDQLKARDREVRAHEQAHAAVGGQYAGAPTYDLQQGPDGLSYAIGGEVSIDVAPVEGDPEATIEKMEIVERAATAPAEPSAQDLRVASQARAQAAEARATLASEPLDADAEGGEDGQGAARDAAARAAYETAQRAQSGLRSGVVAFAA